MENLDNSQKEPDPQQERELLTLVRKNSPYVILERSLLPIINFLITVYIIRILTVDEYGIYKILLAVMSYVGLFSSLGLPRVFRRFIPEFFQKKEFAKLKSLVQKGIFWRTVLCVGIVVIIIVLAEPIGNLFNFQQAMQYFAIFSIGIIFHLSSNLIGATLISVFRHKMYVLSQILYVLFRGGLTYYLLSHGKGLVGLLIAESAAYGLLLALYFFHYRRFIASQAIEKKADLPFRRLVRFGGFSYFNEVGAQILSVSTDYLIISAFLGPIAVGIYGFANRLMFLVARALPQSMFISIIRPTFFMKYVQNDTPSQTNRMFNFLTKLICFFAFPLLIGIVLLGDKIIYYVFDPKYMDSLTILWIVAGFHSINYFMDPISMVLESTEKVQILFYSKIFAIYNLIGDLLVVKPYGIVGVAVVTGTAVVFKNLFCFFYAKKYAAIKLELKGIIIIGINALIMTVPIYLLRPFIQNIPTLVLTILIGSSIYLAASYLNKSFSESERKMVNSILPRPVFSF